MDGAVEIRPFDLTLDDPGAACPAILAYYAHTVDVTFPEAGPILVRAVGEAAVFSSDGTRRREPQTRELGIVVR